MTPYVQAMLRELSNDLPKMAESMHGESLREAFMFRCSEILSLAPAHDCEPAKKVIEDLRGRYAW